MLYLHFCRGNVSWNIDLISNFFNFQIAPVTFNDSDEYIHTTETIRDVQEIQRFFNENASQAHFKGLTTIKMITPHSYSYSTVQQCYKTANDIFHIITTKQ